MDPRKQWTQRQAQLRKLLSAKTSFEEAILLFMQQHAAVHTAKVSGGNGWSLSDEALAGLTDEQIKTVPRPGANSIAWLLWHAARIEDITITFLVLGRPQILVQADWAARLGLPLRDVGAGMIEAEVEKFSARVSVTALKAYRAAVGRSTRFGVGLLEPSQLKEIAPASAIQQLVDEGSISAKAPWLAKFYSNRPKAFFLTRTATSHNFLHLNQAFRLAAKLRAA